MWMRDTWDEMDMLERAWPVTVGIIVRGSAVT